MTIIRSLLFNMGFYAWTTVVLVGAIPSLLGPVQWLVRVHKLWTNGIIVLLKIAGIRVEFRGFEDLPEPPYILASKHQSAFDTLIFQKKIDNPAVVLKRELTWIPLYGWYVRRAGSIPIDRGGRDKAVRRMLRRAAKLRDDGRVIMIFPEGTRTRPGKRRSYLPGVAGLYRHLDIPVVPVALNSGLFWPRRTFWRYPGTIVIQCLPAIPPGLDRRTFMTRLTETLEGGSDALIEEARRDGVNSPLLPAPPEDKTQKD